MPELRLTAAKPPRCRRHLLKQQDRTEEPMVALQRPRSYRIVTSYAEGVILDEVEKPRFLAVCKALTLLALFVDALLSEVLDACQLIWRRAGHRHHQSTATPRLAQASDWRMCPSAGMPLEDILFCPDHATQEVYILQELFILNHQAIATLDLEPKHSLFNFHASGSRSRAAFVAEPASNAFLGQLMIRFES